MPENADPMSALREAAVARIAEDWFTAKYPHIEDAVGAAFDSGYAAARRASIPPDRDAEIEALAEAMDESFWPDDLPFVDDRRGFWLPFAAKVVDFRTASSLEGARHPEAGEPREHVHEGEWCTACVRHGWYQGVGDVGRIEQEDAAAASPGARHDVPGEYGRLLAEWDRLIAEGADPDDLLVPDPPGPSA